MLPLGPHLEDPYSAELSCGQSGNAKFATAQPATCQHLMKSTAQAPDRVSLGHSAILRPLIGRAGSDHPIIPRRRGVVTAERNESATRPRRREARPPRTTTLNRCDGPGR
jgi:hypothetical protein